MKTLSIFCTAAMFLIGGIITHNIPVLEQIIEAFSLVSIKLPAVGSLFASTVLVLSNLFAGILVGTISVFIMKLIQRFAKLS